VLNPEQGASLVLFRHIIWAGLHSLFNELYPYQTIKVISDGEYNSCITNLSHYGEGSVAPTWIDALQQGLMY
jgi:hypothetical protein